MYRRLDGSRIVETLERLRQRIGERFPGSGTLAGVGRPARRRSESMERAGDLRRAQIPLRVATWALIAIIVFVALEALLHLRLAPRWEEFRRVPAILPGHSRCGIPRGSRVLFLANVETRIQAAAARCGAARAAEHRRISSTCTS